MKVEKIIITEISPEELPAVLEALQAKRQSIFEEALKSMGIGMGSGLMTHLMNVENEKINKVPITLTADAVEAEGNITISYDRPGFIGPVSCQLPAAKFPPMAQLKQGAKLLLVFKGPGKPFEETVLGVELPKREKKAPAAGEKDKEKP